MDRILTVSCKLEVTPEQAQKIDATLQASADACHYVNRETPAKLSNQIALQSLVYQEVRAHFRLSANLTIQAIRRMAAHRKAGKPAKAFAPTSASYDARIFSFRERD